MDEKQITPFRSIYLSLLNDRKVKSQADFARQIKFGAVQISEMLRGQKPMPHRLLKALYRTYGVNINYIIGEGNGEPIYIKDYCSEMANANTANLDTSFKAKEQQLHNEIEFLKKVIQDKDKIISLLEKQKS